MPGVIRVYTYLISKPSDPLVAGQAMTQAAEFVHKFNKWVERVEISHPDGDIMIKLHMKANDQWMIKKKVIFPLASLLTKGGLTLKDARLLSVERPEVAQVTWSRELKAAKAAAEAADNQA